MKLSWFGASRVELAAGEPNGVSDSGRRADPRPAISAYTRKRNPANPHSQPGPGSLENVAGAELATAAAD